MNRTTRSQSVKRSGSPMARASGSGFMKRSREKVVILEDAWLEALKYLSCPKWSKMRLVSCQLNGFVHRNVSRLALAIISSAEMRLEERKKTEVKLIVSDPIITIAEKDQWFQDRGITLDLPANIRLKNAILGANMKKNCCSDLCVLGYAQETELTPFE